MVALAQLAAAGFPEIDFPPGADLLQIPWCVGYHDQTLVRPVWRRAAKGTDCGSYESVSGPSHSQPRSTACAVMETVG